MKITSLDKEIKKVFETGYYEVPRFQRPYSWEKEHIIEFWNDTVIDNEGDYFIGSIVVYTKTTEIFGIADGQQRLTTITMILCALRDFYKRESFDNQARGVHVLVEKSDLDDKKSYILQTETSYPYFQEFIQKFEEPDTEPSFSDEEINLKNAFEQITSYINDGISSIKADNTIDLKRKNFDIHLYLNEIRDKILKLKVIYIELTDEDDAYDIFETLNTRGKDLGVSDLVKNYLIKNIKLQNKNVDIPKDKWNTIRKNIDAANADLELDSFILHVWLSKYDSIPKRALFKKLRATIKPAEAKLFLNSLLADSVLYQQIFNPELKIWSKNELSLKKSLIALNGFKVVQHTPMVLAVLRNYSGGRLKLRQVQDILESIEHFHYVFNAVTSQRSSGSVASMYSTYARKLNLENDDNQIGIIIREFRQKLREKMPTYGQFLVSFKGLKFDNTFTKQKKIIHYTLAKIDKKFNVSAVDIDYNTMTIEHMLAQKPNSRIPDHDNYVGMIGNLALLSQKANSSLGNKDFSEKKKLILLANIYLDKVLKSAESWSKDDIDKRTEELADLAYNQVFKV